MDRIFGLDHSHPQYEELELLTTVYNQPELLIVQGLLTDAEIPFLIKERGTGSSMKIITGFSIFGTDVYVLRDQLELATELLSALPEEEEVPVETEEETE